MNNIQNTNTRFHWACGIEDTFIADPHPVTKKTLDEYDLTGHYVQWKNDLDRVAGLGVDSLRWGIPWYKVNPQKNIWDWTWIDQVIPYLVQEKKVDIILDLMHYGTPGWIENSFLHPDYPQYVEEYTARVIERYRPLLKMVTPFNEPHTACEFAGNRGEWPPYLKGMDGYIAVFRGIMYGSVRQTKLLQEAGIECIHVECSGGSWATEAKYEKQALVDRSLQSMYWDFLTGTMNDTHPIFTFLLEHGISEKDIRWFADNGRTIDVMGVNYYPQFSYQELRSADDGSMLRVNHGEWTKDFEKVLRKRYDTYKCPMMITETSIRDDLDMKVRWLSDSTQSVLRLKKEGLPIIGYTWFPIIDMYDWDYRIKKGSKEQFKACFGFWDKNRIENMGAQTYRDIISNAKK